MNTVTVFILSVGFVGYTFAMRSYFDRRFETLERLLTHAQKCPNIINEQSIETLAQRIEKAKKGAV